MKGIVINVCYLINKGSDNSPQGSWFLQQFGLRRNILIPLASFLAHNYLFVYKMHSGRGAGGGAFSPLALSLLLYKVASVQEQCTRATFSPHQIPPAFGILVLPLKIQAFSDICEYRKTRLINEKASSVRFVCTFGKCSRHSHYKDNYRWKVSKMV